MESSIAEFVERQLACELLPTESRQDQALKLVKCFGHLKRGWECACLANQQKKCRVCADFPEDPASGILAEGAIALSVTLSGGALFAS